jgi:hypothetical protein
VVNIEELQKLVFTNKKNSIRIPPMIYK